MSKIISLIFLVFLIIESGCTSVKIFGYYETYNSIFDETINNSNRKINKYNLVTKNLRSEHLERLDQIISNKYLHLETDLGTCEITGLFILKDSYIYITCGYAQIFICTDKGIEKILLNEIGNDMLFYLIKDVKNI